MGKGDVKVAIIGDASSLVGAFGKASAAGSAFSGVFAGVGMAFGQDLMSMAKQVANFAGDSISKFEDLGVQTRKVMRQTGMDATTASTLIGLARDVGVSYEDLSKSLKIFDKNLVSGKVGDYADAVKEADKGSRDYAKATEDLAKKQQRLADLQAIQHSKAHLTVSDNIALRDAIQDVNDAQQKVNEASQAGADDFTKIGIVTRDANGQLLPMTEILANTADHFESLGDGAEATAEAQKLFGKSGEAMLPLLQQGGDYIRENADELQKYGLVLDDAGVAKALAAKKASRELSMAWEGVQVQIGEKLAPVLTNLANWMRDQLPGAIQAAKQWLDQHKTDFENVGNAIYNAFLWAKDTLPGVLDNVRDKINGVVEAAGKIGNWWTEHIGTWNDFEQGTIKVANAMDSLGQKAGWVKDNILDPLIGTIEKIVDLYNSNPILQGPAGMLGKAGGVDTSHAAFGPVGMIYDALSGHASGGTLGPGWSVVGENGKESAFTAGGVTTVFPDGGRAAGMSQGQTINLTIPVSIGGQQLGTITKRVDLAVA